MFEKNIVFINFDKIKPILKVYMELKKQSYIYLVLFLQVLFLSSCGSSKENLTYFETLDSLSGTIKIDVPKITLLPEDELTITVSSLAPEATASYNKPVVNPANPSSKTLNISPQQSTYIVDSKGDINFPNLGNIHVAGMTTEELTGYLTDKIGKDVVDPLVDVQLINFRVHVIGEVAKPGEIKGNGKSMTILEAISNAGDLTPYGKRDNVLLIRKENGANKYYRLNLNDSTILGSPLYYLKQNDVIVVEPNSIRKENAKYNQNNSYKLSVVSTIVSASSVVASLAIALAVK